MLTGNRDVTRTYSLCLFVFLVAMSLCSLVASRSLRQTYQLSPLIIDGWSSAGPYRSCWKWPYPYAVVRKIPTGCWFATRRNQLRSGTFRVRLPARRDNWQRRGIHRSQKHRNDLPRYRIFDWHFRFLIEPPFLLHNQPRAAAEGEVRPGPA